MESYTVQADQQLFDVCIQVYGSLDYLSNLVSDNDLKQDDMIAEGRQILFNPLIGDLRVKEYYNTNRFTPISRKPIATGASDGGFDYGFDADFS